MTGNLNFAKITIIYISLLFSLFIFQLYRELWFGNIQYVKDSNESSEIDYAPHITFVKRNIEPNPGGFNFTKKVIFISSYIRSGSTFFADLIQSHSEIFYHFEPLFRNQVYSNWAWQEQIQEIENTVNCNYFQMPDALNYTIHNTWIWGMNKKLPTGTIDLLHLSNPDVISQFCSMYPIQLIKSVRFFPDEMERLFPNSKDFHYIFLVRDPRSTYLSRKKAEWCVWNPSCMKVADNCEHIAKMYEPMKRLKEKYGDQVHLIKFEDLALDTMKFIKDLFEKMEISWEDEMEEYIDKHTRGEGDEGDTMTTIRKSQSRIDLWKRELSFDEVHFVETECFKTMQMFNYTFMTYD